MKKIAWLLVLPFLWSAPSLAQQKDRVATFIRTTLGTRSANIVAAAAAMPADKYAFRSAPEQQTFGQLVLHIADVNYLYCSNIGGVAVPELPKVSDTGAKDKLMERLKSSFDFCTTAFAQLDDSHMAETLTVGDTKASRAMTILTLTGTWNDHYNMLAEDLRFSGQMLPAASK